MLGPVRSRLPALTVRISRPLLRPLSKSTRLQRQGPGTGENFVQANDPLPRKETPNVSKTNELAVDAMGAQDKPLQEFDAEGEKQRQMQAPNRRGPRPYAAIELIHRQPVRWVHESKVACDGGGGPLGHPKIFINVDKPQVCHCTYCGLPYANEHHRAHLESLPSTTYPLQPTGDPDEVQMPSSPSQMGHIQGTHPHLAGELHAQSMDGKPVSQR